MSLLGMNIGKYLRIKHIRAVKYVLEMPEIV
jgi:hypothetical protein